MKKFCCFLYFFLQICNRSIFRFCSRSLFYFKNINPPIPDSKSAQSWYFFSILEISKFLGFQNVFPKLHEPSWFWIFFVFSWNSLLFCASLHATDLEKNDTKRNDHVFPKLNEPSWFLQIFVLENNIFHIFYFLFPNTYVKLFISWFSTFLCLFPDWYTHETHFACNEELRHRGVKAFPEKPFFSKKTLFGFLSKIRF